MYDGQEVIGHWVNFVGTQDELDFAIVAMLQEMLNRDNAMVGIFKQARQRFNSLDQIPINIKLLETRTTDGRFKNIITQNDYEFAGFVVDNDFVNKKNMFDENKKLGLKHISNLHPCFMSIQYPMFFSYREDGYRIYIKHPNAPGTKNQRMSTVS